MAKTQTTTLTPAEQDSLRELAGRILARAKEIRAPNMKERAMYLARLLLQEDRKFGERQLREEQTAALLEAEDIGLASFRKALTAARQELPEMLPPLKPRRSTPSTPKPVRPTASAAVTAKSSPTTSSVAATVDRTLL